MSRMEFYGYEIATPGPGGSVEGAPLSGTVSRDTTSQRTGSGCLKCDSGAGNAAAAASFSSAANPSSTNYYRVYMRFANLPLSACRIIGVLTGSNFVSARLTPGGKIQLWNDVTSAQIGSDSSATITAGANYYRIEISHTYDAGLNLTSCELRLDGVSVAIGSGLSIPFVSSGGLGWLSAPGANCVCYVDDVAVNSSAGAVNNSWCGDGKVVLLKPTADSAVGTGWTLGTGTAISGNSGKTAVSNTPPLGVADLAAGSDVKQIRNVASSANSNYDATMTTYTAAGIGASDVINAIKSWVATAAPVVTSAKQGTAGIVSNPTVANIALASGGTAGAFWSGSAGAAYTTGWKWSPGTQTETPTVTKGTAPVMRITQVTANTQIAVVCFMGIYVEYTPAVAAKSLPPVGRSSSYRQLTRWWS